MVKTGAGPSAGPSHDPGLVLILIVGLIGLAAWLFWRFFHTEISTVVLAVKGAEAAAISVLTRRLDLILAWIAETDRSSVSPEQLAYVARSVGAVYAWPVAALLGAMAAWSALRMPSERYRRRFDMDRLLAAQSREWAAVANMVNRKPHTKAPRPYEIPVADDPALYPHEWIRAYAMPANPEGTRPFDEERARKALAAQLGDPWTEPEKAPPHVRVLFAAFALKAAHRKDEARAILAAASQSFAPGRREARLSDEAIALADRAIANTEATKRGRKAAAGHAYVSGALRAALQVARDKDGVLASAEFTWLKGIDRALWYALNGLGRATAWPECAGAVAHWAMERAARQPIDTPCIEAACQALLAHVERASANDAAGD